MKKIGTVIISYGHENILPELVSRIHAQMKPGDRLVVVDNHPNGKGADSVVSNDFVDYAIKAENKGYSSGCNIGSAKIMNDVDTFLFLNPATHPAEQLLDAVRNVDYDKYAAVMPLISLPNNTINSAGNTVHISGLSWCDAYGEPINSQKVDKEISVLSGICIAISKEWWNKIGGMSEAYFMYYEDTDISSRLLLMGGKLGLLANVIVEHDYDYKKGGYKWLYLERNRPVYIILNWPSSVIAVLAIQLICVGIGLWFVALFQGRFRSKLKAFTMSIKELPVLLRERSRFKKKIKISGYDFLKTLDFKLDTPMLGRVGKNKFIEFVFSAYYKISLIILKPFRNI